MALTTSPAKDLLDHVPALDGWRGLAIILVLLGHFGGDSSHYWCSSLGVDLFFALSGRLMADILFVRRLPLRIFLARRFARIYPTLVVFVLIAFLITEGSKLAFSPQTALLALTFTLNYAVTYGHGFSSLDHIWSLCVEEHSYILLAGIALVCSRLPVKTAGLVILGLGLAAIANAVAQLDVLHWNPFVVLWRTDTAMAGLFVAAGFRLLLGSNSGNSPWWRWVAPLALLCAVIARSNGSEAFVYVGIKSLLLALAVVRVEDAWSPMRAFFETNLLRFVGQCSFSLYLWQEMFYKMARQDAVPAMPFLIAAVACGLLGYYLIERPLRAAFGTLLFRRPALQAAAG